MLKSIKAIAFSVLCFGLMSSAAHAQFKIKWPDELKISKHDVYKVVPKVHKDDFFGGGQTTFVDGRGVAVSGVSIANSTNMTINYAMLEKGNWVQYSLPPQGQRSHFSAGNPQSHPSIQFDSNFAQGFQPKSYSLPGSVQINRNPEISAQHTYEFRQVQNGIELFRR